MYVNNDLMMAFSGILGDTMMWLRVKVFINRRSYIKLYMNLYYRCKCGCNLNVRDGTINIMAIMGACGLFLSFFSTLVI